MHSRMRHIHGIFSKRMRMFPVVGLLGPRQVGKTTFLMHQWQRARRAHYVTLDKLEVLRRAERSPENFLLAASEDLQRSLIIDEVQKAPALFDGIKALIDAQRRVGAFAVSGSVEFSDRSGVRESLAGRMGITRLYPMTLRELLQQRLQTPWVRGIATHRNAVPVHAVETWLQRGGMPIFCALHDTAERNQVIAQWLEAICYRDIQRLNLGKLAGEVALAVLQSIARAPNLNQSKLANEIGVSRSDIVRYLAALEALFLVYRIPAFGNRRAVPEYIIFDPAVMRSLLGTNEDSFTRWQSCRTLVLNEILAQHEYSGQPRPEIAVFRARGGANVDLVLRDHRQFFGIDICLTSDITPYAVRGMKSFLRTYPKAKGLIVAPVVDRAKIDGITIVPWWAIG